MCCVRGGTVFKRVVCYAVHLLDRANVELRSRKRELRHLDEMLDALPAGRIAAAAKAESTPVTNGPQSRTGRRVLLAPHPSPGWRRRPCGGTSWYTTLQ